MNIRLNMTWYFLLAVNVLHYCYREGKFVWFRSFSLSMRYVNNRCFISKILLVCCVHSLDFRYRELVRKYHTDRLCMKYSISFVLIDIDECLNRSHACDVNANCTNTDGSYNCTCKEGYTGDGQSCQGILDQTVHHTGLLLTISRACPKFTNMERYNAIYKFRHGR